MGLLFFVFLIPLVAGRSVKQKLCLAVDGDFYSLISTMTPYDDVRGKIDEIKGCEIGGLWAFIRHGTRFPKDYAIRTLSNLTHLRDAILENHAESRGQLCLDDLNGLRHWKFEPRLQDEMSLTASGREELRQLGTRMRKVFKDLIKKKRNNVEIKITSKERTKQSAEALTVGFLERPLNSQEFIVDDVLLKNEKSCPNWKKSTKSVKWRAEIEKFKNTTEVQNLLRRVSHRLGFQNDLDFEIINHVYEVCTYEYSWYHSTKHIPWCAAFTKEDMKLLEYFEDLSYYYKSAYGNENVPKLGCQLIGDIIERLPRQDPKVMLHFGHSSGNRKLLVSLGIANGNPLSGDGYRESADRNWRTSYLTPFSANLFGVLYECKKGAYGIKEKNRIAIYVNEKLIKLAACGRKIMCGLEEFRQAYFHITDPKYCNKDFCILLSPENNATTENGPQTPITISTTGNVSPTTTPIPVPEILELARNI